MSVDQNQHEPAARFARLLSGVAALVLLAGCGASDDTTTNTQPPQASQDNTTIGDTESPVAGSLVLPFGPTFVGSESDAATLDRAVQVLAAQCMDAKGYTLPEFPPDPFQPLMTAQFRYGGFAPGQAESSGYRPADYLGLADLQDQFDVLDQSLPQDETFFEALNGEYDPDGSAAPNTIGCIDEAQVQIYGAVGGFDGLPNYQAILEMQIDSIDQLYASAQGQDAISEWSRCMADGGYTATELFEPQTQWPYDVGNREPASEDERQMATVDSSCRSSVDLEARLFEAESAIQTEMIEKNSGVFEAHSDEIDAAMQNAQQALQD